MALLGTRSVHVRYTGTQKTFDKWHIFTCVESLSSVFLFLCLFFPFLREMAYSLLKIPILRTFQNFFFCVHEHVKGAHRIQSKKKRHLGYIAKKKNLHEHGMGAHRIHGKVPKAPGPGYPLHSLHSRDRETWCVCVCVCVCVYVDVANISSPAFSLVFLSELVPGRRTFSH